VRRRRSPWTSATALGGAAAGAALALMVRLLPGGGSPVMKFAGAPAAAGLCYAIGVLLACRRARLEDARRLIDLQEELRFSQDHIMANETFRSLGAYLEIAAHQMKEPLQAVATGVAALAADGGLPEAARRQVAALKTNLERLNETLRHLAGYGLNKPGRAPFSVNVLLHEAILLCRRRAAEKTISFAERYGVVPPVMGSATRVHQAIFNIIVNAVEAMPFGGGTIVVETRHENDRVIARVRDSGIGIRPEHMPHIFEPFFTTKPEKKGVGLGLWAARQMLDIVGADVTVKSTPLQGTEVTLSFPQAAPLRPGREGTIHPPELPRNTADERGRRIA